MNEQIVKVNSQRTKMVLSEDVERVPANCRVTKSERENFTDKVGTGAHKREVSKLRITTEKECEWRDVDKKALQKQRLINKQRKQKVDRLQAEKEEENQYYKDLGRGDFVGINKAVLDAILDEISPEGEADIDIKETEKLPPAELRKRRQEKARTARDKARERMTQNRREKWIRGVLEEVEKALEKDGALKPKSGKGVTIKIQKSKPDEVEEAKKKKPNCSKGNVWHDENGRFTDKKGAKSYSLQWVKGGSDCKSGAARMPGQRFTKLPCGRRSKHSQNKAKYKCKDGTPSSSRKPEK